MAKCTLQSAPWLKRISSSQNYGLWNPPVLAKGIVQLRPGHLQNDLHICHQNNPASWDSHQPSAKWGQGLHCVCLVPCQVSGPSGGIWQTISKQWISKVEWILGMRKQRLRQGRPLFQSHTPSKQLVPLTLQLSSEYHFSCQDKDNSNCQTSPCTW